MVASVCVNLTNRPLKYAAGSMGYEADRMRSELSIGSMNVKNATQPIIGVTKNDAISHEE